jgi:hypothetical protein
MTASGPRVRVGGARRVGALVSTVVAALLALLLVAIALAPAAAAAAAAKQPSPSTTAPVPKKWDPRLKPIADEVAKLRKLDFEHPVAAQFLDDAEFEKKVSIDRGKLSKQDKEDVERSTAQLRAVGLIGPDVDLVDAVSSSQTAGVLAFYDPKTKRITVKGTNVDDVATRVTVAHELTHALQDQHFDLQKLDKQAAADHGSTALQTVVEGDAVRIQNAYEQTLSSAEQQKYESENAAVSQQAQDQIKAKGVPDTITVIFQAPYALGESMLDAVLAKDKEAGIDALFRDPPTADSSFVTPSTLLDHRTFQKVKTPALQAGEKQEGKPDVFGALSLYQVLASRLDNATALSAADAWDGDAMVTFERQGQTCLRATFAGKGTKGVGTITDALHQWAAQVPAGGATVEGGGDRVTLTACDTGNAAPAIPNPPLTSLVYLSTRDGLFAELVKQGLSTTEASCSSDDLVRDPTFAPILQATANDPNAQPDESAITAVRSRLREIVTQCRTT